MHIVGLQTAIWNNRFKTFLLVALLPLFLFVSLFVVFFVWAHPKETTSSVPASEIVQPLSMAERTQQSLDINISIFRFLGPVLLVWLLISFFFHRQMIFAFSGAHPITRKTHPEVYNIVENLCISRGLPLVQIGIIEDESMNAFAVGWNPKKAWIVFSSGLLRRLSRSEVEAVAAHELTHIMNRDSLLMVVVICFVGAVATIGEILVRFRSRSRNEKDQGSAFFIVGLVFLVLGYLLLPLVQLAISRRREFLADAGAVELTHNASAMINALRKISSDSRIESIEKATVAAMCIENPLEKKGSGLGSWFRNILSTHPSIEDRIAALESY